MSVIQSVRFKKKYYDSKKARSWLIQHKLKPIKRVDKKGNWLRYRIKDPKKFKRFATKVVSNGKIHLLIGFKK